MFNQGLVVYETLLSKKSYSFSLTVHDFALVYLDGTLLGELSRGTSTDHTLVADCAHASCKLSILVEAMGHINFDHEMETDRKGLFKISDNHSTKFTWDIYKVNIEESLLKWNKLTDPRPFPALLKGTFSLASVGDTYLNLSNYKKGYVWVNGKNLGRYWNVGPEQKLFCPGVWLKQGLNEVFILEMETDASLEVRGDKTLV